MLLTFSIHTRGIESKGNFSSDCGTDPDELAFWKQEPLLDHLLYSVAQKCWEKNGDHLLYVGTAAVVRDLVAMHDVIEGPTSLINFWGLRFDPLLIICQFRAHSAFAVMGLS